MREDIGEVVYPDVAPVDGNVDQFRASLVDDFRNSMRNLASSVSVVTVGSGEQASGFTATSVVSLSMEPPTLLVSLNRASGNWPLVQESGGFSVNILSQSHLEVAETFAGRRGLKGKERYVDARWAQEPGCVPHLPDSLVVLECRLEDAILRYSHALLIGRVTKVIPGRAASPLVYWQGRYQRLCDNS